MNAVEFFLSLPFESRVILLLGILLLIWLLFGKVIFRLLSIIPFLLRKIFLVLYMLIEWPLASLHKRLGGKFYHIDNRFAAIGKKIDCYLHSWYQMWRRPQKRYAGIAIIVYILCLACIISPSYIHIKAGSWLNFGQTVYLRAETSAVAKLESYGWYSPEAYLRVEDESEILEDVPTDVVQITLVVNVSDALKVRDVPSTVDDTVLDILRNGDIVIWNGQMTFGMAEGRQEAWVKVTTATGIEGWCRLFYLQPEQSLNLMVLPAS